LCIIVDNILMQTQIVIEETAQRGRQPKRLSTTYETQEEALETAKAVVESGLLELWHQGMSEQALLQEWSALGEEVRGYEIHHGRVTRGPEAEEFPGGAAAGAVLGTMWHGTLESDGFRQAWLGLAAAAAGTSYHPSGVRFGERREARYELLADLAEEHLDVDALLDLAVTGPPAGLPVLPPGAR